MALTLTEKLIRDHHADGVMLTGERVGIRIDQTLTHDVNGVMAYLEFEALGIDRVRGDVAVSYIDHNLLQADFKNPDDHRFLMDMAKRYGSVCSKMGNGICHQLHVERFAVPGKTLLGSDSHTPACGGAGMLAIGAGGMDVAVAMAGEPFFFKMPGVVNVILKGKLPDHLSVKNVNLELLRRLSVKGGLGAVLEYSGPAIADLNVSQRATLCNMGAETGATTSIFPSDEVTLRWMKAQNRERDWTPQQADPGAKYAEVVEIDLSALEALIALPHQPDNVVPVAEVAGLAVDQVVLGGCTNASLQDVLLMAHLFEGGRVHPDVDAGLYCGSQQVMLEAVNRGAIAAMIRSGVRIFEMFCGACNGMGFAPPTNGVSLRTGPRNFRGRCGHPSGQVYLVAPETAVASAIAGKITNPASPGKPRMAYAVPERFIIDDSRFILPGDGAPQDMPIRRGPNIRPLPAIEPLEDVVEAEILLYLPDDITTDHIVPAGANFLPIRANTPEIAKHSFNVVDMTFPDRAKAAGSGVLMAGRNYGQGSSREQAALVPRYLGIRAIIAESFARIHLANLVNFGLLPLVFDKPEDRALFAQGDTVRVDTAALVEGKTYTVINVGSGVTATATSPLFQEELDIIKAGGRLNWIRRRNEQQTA
jgi:aconitate hydratase